MVEGRLAIIGVVGLLSACSDTASRESPAIDAEVTTNVGLGTGGGWDSVGSIEARPALSLYESGRPTVVLTCEGTSTRVQVRGFEPKQAWPQPELIIRFGGTTRAETPDVRNIGDQVAYEIEFQIADDVLEPIRSGAPLRVEFDSQTRSVDPIPQNQAAVFAERCGALVPAQMRQNNRSAS